MKNKLYSTIFQLIFHFILISFQTKIYIKCICNRNAPILKDGICQSIYCTENEFKENICSIDNEIIKTQWLNNFINLDEYRYRFTNMVITEEGDLILFTSPEETNGQRLLFRLTKNGRAYYKSSDNQEILYKNIEVLDGDEGAMRYESQIFLMKLKNDNEDNKEYLVSISLYHGFMEIYDINDNNIPFSKISVWDFGGNIIFSKRGATIDLNNKEYLYFFVGQYYNTDWYYKAFLKKYIFYDYNIDKDNVNEKTLIEDQITLDIIYSRVVSAFKTELNQIILFYINNESKFKIEVYNEALDFQYEKYYDQVKNFNSEDSLFMKAIYLKQNIGIIAYYYDSQIYHPKIFVENIRETEFSEILSFELIQYNFNTKPLFNDLIKMNNKRFCFILTSNDNLVLYIVLFDLYNNDANIKIRYYIINIYELYNYKIYKELSSILYNNYLALSFSACFSNQCDNEDNPQFFTTLLIFNYINATDYNINISSYFSNQDNINANNDDIYLNFSNYFKIDNNIFGYQIKQNIKISYIPEEITLYKLKDDNLKIEINIGDEYNPEEDTQLIISPKNNITKNDTTYFIEYQYQYSEPDYETFNKYPNEIYDYPENPNVNQEDEFNADINIYYGSSIRITFKLCNENCKTCKLIGKSDAQTKCEECKDNFKFYLDNSSDTNTCFSNEKDCPLDSPFLLRDNSYKCVKSCKIEEIKNDSCILDNSSKESLTQAHNMFKDIISDNYNNEDIVLRTDDDITFQLSNSLNEKTKLTEGKGLYYNLSIIDLGECENKLKSENNLSNDIPLIIFKLETYYENTTIRNVQYEIYNPVTKEKITDFSPCEDEKINIYVPTNLDNKTYTLYEELKNQGYEIFNANDSFYNDVCTKYTSINNTDITLNDRKELFYNETQIFCQEDCEYKGIDLETQHAQCECSVSSSKTDIVLGTEVFTGFEIITSFYEVIKFSNFLILKCYKLFFSSLGIKNNFGFIIMIILITFHISMLITFLFTGMQKIKEQLSNMIFLSMNKEKKISIKTKSSKIENIKKQIFPQNPKKKISKNHYKHQKNIFLVKNMKIYAKKSSTMQEKSSSSGLHHKKSSLNALLKKNLLKKNNKKSSPLIRHNKIKKKTKNEKLKYSEFELDDLEYLEAIKYDKRTFFEFFLCLVKREHIIIFTFIFCKDLNLLCIKLALFVFAVSLDFATNVLFFTDDSMHKIYLDYGKYNFIQQIPQIIYSTVISEAFDVFFKFLSLSEKEIYGVKKFSSFPKVIVKVKKIMRRLKIKFFLFFLISFLLMSFFCYFISCFCAVYENTQNTLFKDSAMSFLISITYPFALYLIPASIRIISLRSKAKDKRFLYKISNIFPLF